MSQRSGQWTGRGQRRQRLSDVTVNMIVTRPIDAIDATIYTSAKVIEDTSAALGALPSLARTLEQLRPGGVLLEEVVKLKKTLDRIDRIGTFVAEELPETQQQLEALNSQLNDSVNRIGELARAILTQTAVNNALNDSIRLLSKGLGVAQGTAETLGRALGRTRATKDET
ncbi:hypothetical protein [Haloechinothrix salitolerans]|uniref:MCE family protein n=1 Tax=Haloechinothrix salitolerans TaxID=926830 RepID=A0ABW2C305_9PSEU